MMLPEIESVRGEQFCGTPEAQQLAWPGVKFPGDRIQFFLREATADSTHKCNFTG
jgi:hypothetical protein